MIERVLNMKFEDSAKGNFTFAVKDIKPEIKDVDIAAAMDSIIAKDIFLSKGGSLKAKAEAQIVTKETTEITL